MKRIPVLLALLLAFYLLIQLPFKAQASALPQLPQFATPTPRPDGTIIYIVQSGDNCIRISLLAGIPLEQLRALNHLDQNCILQEGQELLLGIGGPSSASPTPGPSPTPTPILPTPTPFFGSAEVCVLLYDDQNGDALREPTEPAIAGGAVSVTGSDTAYSQSQTTAIISDATAYQGLCFNDVPEGDYNVSVAIPDGYNATTLLRNTMTVKAGDTTFVSFGAQGSNKPAASTTPDDSNRSPLLGILGAILLLGGLGLGFYASRGIRNRPRGLMR